jgi:hypothetical protein
MKEENAIINVNASNTVISSTPFRGFADHHLAIIAYAV